MSSKAAAPADEAAPFWKRKSLGELDEAEWESLCDGCGRCCLVKLEDEDTGAVHYTDLGCRLLDTTSCRCSDYRRRSRKVSDCLKLTPRTVEALSWLPPTCGYRLVAKGKDLAWWHPLVSGSRDSVHDAGVSVRGRVFAMETDLDVELYPDRIVKWPTRFPKKARASDG